MHLCIFSSRFKLVLNISLLFCNLHLKFLTVTSNPFCQLELSALVVATVFAQARKRHDSIDDGVVFLGALYFGLNSITFTGFYELPMTIEKLPVFYKQRDLHFYPSWAFSLPASIFGIPTSFIEVAFWVAITYFIIGFDPSFTRS